MKKILLLLLFILFFFSANRAGFSDPIEAAVMFDVDIINDLDNPKIRLSWQPDSAKRFEISRKLLSDKNFTLLKKLDSNSSEFIDEDIEIGVGYDYYIKKVFRLYDAYGHGYVGSKLPVKEFSGRVLILVDETMSVPLAYELSRFRQDIKAEGHQTTLRTVPRTEEFDPDAVAHIKDIIDAEFDHSDSLTTVVLFGRIAVPYSGESAPDGHPDHVGAWPADVYYGVMNAEWTDETVSSDTSKSARNHNFPGDGKFDQTSIPGDVSVRVGRIDFYDLPAYEISETELLRNYLEKDHNFRSSKIKVPNRAIIDDNFGDYAEGFATLAWFNFSSLCGSENIIEGDFRDVLTAEPYLWSYGCGEGSPVSIHKIAYVHNFVDSSFYGVFTCMFGSWNGDWDTTNNILRMGLASSPFILTVAWAGRPFWFFQHMGLGEEYGYSGMLSQNNKMLYESPGIYATKQMHTSILGDPTLTMYHVEAPTKYFHYLEFSDTNRAIILNWRASPNTDVSSYNVYRSGEPDGKYLKINENPVTDLIYRDDRPLPGSNNYCVRAVKLQETPTGSFYNQSPGIFYETEAPHFDLNAELLNEFLLSPNPAKDYINYNFVIHYSTFIDINVIDIRGKLLKQLHNEPLDPGKYTFTYDLTDENGSKLPIGVYYLTVKTARKSFIRKIQIGE
ncbi:MAG: hypothetical protein PF588_03310 [Candidatus Kapabacteria bacterium]|nr:hypothetical protein [Candidatus Kapabacteria bacterium]